jgi:hypothetical protein
VFREAAASCPLAVNRSRGHTFIKNYGQLILRKVNFISGSFARKDDNNITHCIFFKVWVALFTYAYGCQWQLSEVVDRDGIPLQMGGQKWF